MRDLGGSLWGKTILQGGSSGEKTVSHGVPLMGQNCDPRGGGAPNILDVENITIADIVRVWVFILLPLVILSGIFFGTHCRKITVFNDMLLPRYMYISSNDKVVRAKKGTGGLHLVKTVKT